MSRMIDETGKRYGMVTVLGRDKNDKNGKAQWLCKCDCGNTFVTRGTDLRRNKVLTCGCTSYTKGQVLVGKTFGRLTVLRFLGTNEYGKHIYECQCTCGNLTVVNGGHLISGNTKSCGCLKQEKSLGEQQIEQILIENNIPFSMQQTFPDLIYKNNLRYDFAIKDENNKIIRLIEFDGVQHFNKNNAWHHETIEIRDQIKNSYALENNIPLVRIPYTVESIELEDIFTDKWLINNI